MEQLYSYIPYSIRSTVADEYIHRILCSRKKNRSGSTPYAIKEIERKRISVKRENKELKENEQDIHNHR